MRLLVLLLVTLARHGCWCGRSTPAPATAASALANASAPAHAHTPRDFACLQLCLDAHFLNCEHFCIRSGSCLTLTEQWRGSVSSVDPYEDCFRLWSGEDCKGKFIEVSPGSSAACKADLSMCNAGDQVHSVGRCPV